MKLDALFKLNPEEELWLGDSCYFLSRVGKSFLFEPSYEIEWIYKYINQVVEKHIRVEFKGVK